MAKLKAHAPLLAAAGIVLATLAAYSNSFQGVFVFDDGGSIVNNPTARHLWPIWKALSPPSGGETVSGRPFLNFTFALNYAVGKLNPWGYHAVNLAIHILAALTLFGIVRRTLLLPSPACGRGAGGEGLDAPAPPLFPTLAASATPLAFAIALLWAVHPLQTESVTYIAQRAESLCGLFYLLTLYCVIRVAAAGVSSRPPSAVPRPPLWYFAAVLACLLGMATKEVMVTAPLVVLLYDRTFLAGSFARAVRRRWLLYLGLAATWAPLGALIAGSYGRGESVGLTLRVTPCQYALTQCGAILRYVRLSFWPTGLCFDYGTPLAKTLSEIAPGALFVAAIAAATLWALARRPAVGFLGAMSLIALAPTSSVVPIVTQTIAEHRMYLALAAEIAAAVVGCSALGGVLVRRSTVSPHARKALGGIVLAMFCIALASLTFRRNADYRSAISIWEDTAANAPRNDRALSNLGNALTNGGDYAAAVEVLRRALEIRPDSVESHNNLGNALLSQGDPSGAIQHYRFVSRTSPGRAEAQNNWASALLSQGNYDDAIEHLREAVKASPQYAEAYNNWGVVLLRQRKFAAAAEKFRTAAELRPQFAEAHYNWGIALLRMSGLREADPHLRTGLGLNPGDAYLREELASAMHECGYDVEAVAQLREAIRLQPASGALLNRAAWILATADDRRARNGREAISLALRALELCGNAQPSALDTLAAAYAEAGRYADAAEAARRAVAAAESQNDAQLATRIRARLKWYESDKPYRLSP